MCCFIGQSINNKTHWDSFRSYIAETPLSALFKEDLLGQPPSFSSFIPHKEHQQKSINQRQFTPECTVAIVHHNHYYLLSKGMVQQDPCLIQNGAQSLQESLEKCKEQLYADSPSQSKKQKTRILQVLKKYANTTQQMQTVSALHHQPP